MMSRNVKTVAATAAITLFLSSAAHAIDVYSGDYTPVPAGQNVGLLYFSYNNSNTLESGGDEIPDSSLNYLAVTGRIVHYTEFAGHQAAVQAFVPIVDFYNPTIDGADIPTADGWGDLTLAAGMWALAAAPDDATGTTLGASLFLTLPTGNYEYGAISSGSGTTSLAVQVGLQQGLGSGFFLDATADATFAVDHTEDGHDVSTDPAYQVQAYLRYQRSARTSFAIGYSGLRGGKQQVDDVYVGTKTDKDTVRLEAKTFVADTLQLAARIDYDVDVEDGFKSEPQFNLRLMKLF